MGDEAATETRDFGNLPRFRILENFLTCSVEIGQYYKLIFALLLPGCQEDNVAS